MNRNAVGNYVFRLFLPILVSLLFATELRAATFTVTNTADSGSGSLRQAITDANMSPGFDTINFNIAGGGVKTIAPLTPLPDITFSVVIDGTTQPGWSVGNHTIELSGENISNPATGNGLYFFDIDENDPASFVRGLTINRFPRAGVATNVSSNITIEGCHIGTDPTGTFARGNFTGIFLEGLISGAISFNNTIGGDTPAERNVISGNDFIGVSFLGGGSHQITGNYIGTDKTGMNALPNGIGVDILASSNVVGGGSVALRNVISGNEGNGLIINGFENVAQGNFIGMAADGLTPLGNGGTGLRILGDGLTNNDHTIGGLNAGEENIIANNGGDGIHIFRNTRPTTGHRILRNSIYDNTGLGIDLDDDGITANDAGDADEGTNNLQNYPVLASSVVGVGGTSVQGTLNSAANTSYRVEFFAVDSNVRQGKTYLGFQNVATDASGNATINASLSATAFSGQFVTATATRNVAPFDTSEFSAPVAVSLTSFIVTNTADSGAGSLRQAIVDANANPDPNLITFAITPLDGSVKTINLLSPLFPITNPVAIDGLTQNGASCGSPKIELNGLNAGGGADGFTVSTNNVSIQGFVINRFSSDGIAATTNNNTIRCNKIGTNVAGNADLGNSASGILLDSAAHFNLIEANTISGNGVSGIRVIISNSNTIQNNIIGLSSDGTTVIPNVSVGITIVGGLNNIIGGAAADKRNVVSGNGGAGIGLLGTTNNSVKGNYIGVNPSGGGTTFGNTGAGILLSADAANNTIGGDEAGAGNLIAFNTMQGIGLISTTDAGNRISQNLIHDNGSLGIDINADGVTANDVGDADTGANNLQNFPVISAAESFFGGLRVSGTFNSTANSSFRIEVFSNSSCDGAGNGEGQAFLGVIEVSTNSSGNASFTETFNTSVPVGNAVTATATRNSAPLDTSEFSACRTVTNLSALPTLNVINTNDSGAGSLRQAILDANTNSSPKQISFNIPGAGVKTITPATALPALTSPVFIDGLTQPGATCANPLIELNGQSAGANSDGLHISASGSIRGLVINRFSGDGIEFDTVGNNIVKCSRIGTDATGTLARGNGLNGIYLNEVSNNTIGGDGGDGNLISANNTRGIGGGGGSPFDGGVRGFLSSGNVIQGNIIGSDVNGNSLNVGMRSGIILSNGSGNLIGGSEPGARNVVNSCGQGIYLQNTASNEIQGNYLGTNLSGDANAAIVNADSGIRIENAANNLIGGSQTGAGNVISNTRTGGGIGINIIGDLSENIVIQGNLIGTNAAGNLDAGNMTGIMVGPQTSAVIGGRTAAERNVISGNDNEGILITNLTASGASPAAVIEGNYIGLGSNGSTIIFNGNGIEIESNATNIQIGGGAAGAGNVISSNVTAGIRLSATTGNQITGNLIGTDAAGAIARGNGVGILLADDATDNIIGGSSAASRNVISGNAVGIATASGAVSASGNLIQKNLIGTAPNGTSALQNSAGIQLASSNNTIAENTIAFNAQKGVNIFSTGAGNRISANSIFSNGNLGIDLGSDGVTPNDGGDTDLANNLQNYPVLSGANATTIAGTLNSAAGTSYTLEFFLSPTADATNFGEGQIYLGALVVTTNGSGDASFNFTPPIILPNGQFIAATAANNATGDTSEFSQVRQILAPTASNVGIQGRVLTAEGRGIYKAAVTLVEPDGNIRTVLTNPFGFYRFTELPAGATYVLSVSHKKYRFGVSTQTVTLNENEENLNFVGENP